MAEIDPYIRILFFQHHSDLDAPEGYDRRDAFIEPLTKMVRNLLEANAVPDITDATAFSLEFFEEFLEAGAYGRIEQKFAGEYITYSKEVYKDYRVKSLRSSEIYQASRAVGVRFFPDVFSGYVRDLSGVEDNLPRMGLAVGSDRIVTFADNQRDEIEVQVTEIIEAVEKKNQIDSQPGLRELIVGQLRAGRELIRAGTFRLHILQFTMLETLRFLATRYERELIGGLAAALLAALLGHLGIAT